MKLLWLLLPFLPTVTPQSLNNSSPSDSLVWGTYRPNLYFGLRPRIPHSLMTGLIWFGTQDYHSITSKSFPNDTCTLPVLMRSTEARHACDQGDGLDHYTWTQFDAREGGIQVLKDSENNVKVTTELLMVDGGNHGGSWAARIKGEPIIKGNNH
jgi:mannosyl-oligosaccharide glucosidase